MKYNPIFIVITLLFLISSCREEQEIAPQEKGIPLEIFVTVESFSSTNPKSRTTDTIIPPPLPKEIKLVYLLLQQTVL